MILKDLLESSLIKDTDTIHLILPLTGNVQDLRTGNWFHDQILDMQDATIDSFFYDGNNWNVNLRSPDVDKE